MQTERLVQSDNNIQKSLAVVVGLLGAAVAATVITFYVAKATGANLLVTPEFSSSEPENLALESVVGATISLSLVGVVLAWLLGRFVGRAKLVFLVGVALGLLAYGALAFEKAENVADALWLNIMHLAAAVPVVGGALTWVIGDRK